MSETARIGMVMIAPGQIQKEVAHNSALERIDMAVQSVVAEVGVTSPPADAAAGDCYVVGAGATGDWAGRDDALAMMGAGGWIYLEAFDGLAVFERSSRASWRYESGGWGVAVHRGSVEDANGDTLLGVRQSAVALPSGGATQDGEARAAIAALVDRLVAHGLIGQG